MTAALDIPFVSYARLAANKSRTLTPPAKAQGESQQQDESGVREMADDGGMRALLWDCPMTRRRSMATIDRLCAGCPCQRLHQCQIQQRERHSDCVYSIFGMRLLCVWFRSCFSCGVNIDVFPLGEAKLKVFRCSRRT